MPQVDFKDVLNIGLPELDKQHRHLISLFNSLIQAMSIGKGVDVLEHLFSELKDYTVYHFTDEERFMEVNGYPAIEGHRARHEALIAQVDEFKKRMMNSAFSPNEALDFVNDWIILHIMNEDTAIGKFIQSRK